MVQGSGEGSLPIYQMTVRRDVMIPARDGVGLATDLYFPAVDGRPAEGKFPTILVRTPYLKKMTRYYRDGLWYARHGYVMAVQDVRGRGESDGVWVPFSEEAEDGYDAVEWLAAQPWSDGQVGTVGTSYGAAVQSALATLDPPHLAAQFIAQGPFNYHSCSMRQNGCLEQRFLIYCFRMACTSKEAEADPDLKRMFEHHHANAAEWCHKFPLRKGETPLALAPSIEQWALDLQQRGEFDEYWQKPSLAINRYYDRHADVPTTFFGSWYDTYARATVTNFTELKKLKKGPYHLIMGPWTHGSDTCESSVSGQTDFGQAAAMDYYPALVMRFFDTYLKNLDTGLRDEPPVSLFVMGGATDRRNPWGQLDHGGEWLTGQDWPPAGADQTPFYLHGDGTLSDRAPEEGEPKATTYRFNPADPVPTVGGCISAADPVLFPGGWDQRGIPARSGKTRVKFPKPTVFNSRDDLPLAARSDVIVFQTEPLAEPKTICGPIRAELYVSSSAVDTDFTVKLIDVIPPNGDYPEGFHLLLTDSIQRCRYRDGYDEAKMMTPGEVYKLEFDLFPTANRFAAGHRIRIDLSSSNWPRFDVNPNTGEPLGCHRRLVMADNTIHHGSETPSRVIMTLI